MVLMYRQAAEEAKFMYLKINKMKDKYIEVNTKKAYKDLLKSMLKETNDYLTRFPELTLYHSISSQIADIIHVIDENIVLEEQQIYDRYSLGAIATKNFDAQNELYARKLQDIFGGLFDYWDMAVE